MVLIHTKKLTKKYHTDAEDLRAIYDVNLEVDTGELLAITGPSGAGKSTLLHLLGCLNTPTMGDYYFDEQNVSHLSLGELAALRNHKMGFVFQDVLLLAHLTATDNVALPLIYAGMAEQTAKERAQAMLKELGLGERLYFLPGQLSGGQQQRVAIARALIMRPKLILADEPTGNLDSENAQHIMDLLIQLNREHKVTVILVTHEMGLANQAQRILTIHDGHIVSDRLT
jgi:putative ABC transport system ATP-binding protein